MNGYKMTMLLAEYTMVHPFNTKMHRYGQQKPLVVPLLVGTMRSHLYSKNHFLFAIWSLHSRQLSSQLSTIPRRARLLFGLDAEGRGNGIFGSSRPQAANSVKFVDLSQYLDVVLSK